MSTSRVVPATAALLLVLTGPAAAGPAAGTMDGTGTYSPGVPVSGCAQQTVTFDGTLVLAGNHIGLYAVHIDGTTSTCATPLAEQGSGTVSRGVHGTVEWTRTGNRVAYTGFLVVDGSVHNIVSGLCTRTWTSLSPALSYADHCDLVLA